MNPLRFNLVTSHVMFTRRKGIKRPNLCHLALPTVFRYLHTARVNLDQLCAYRTYTNRKHFLLSFIAVNLLGFRKIHVLFSLILIFFGSKMKPIHYSWFFFLLKYSNGRPESIANNPPQLTPIYSTTDGSLQKVATAGSADEDSWNYLFHRSRVELRSAADKYCKNIYNLQEVEALLDIGK